MGVTPRVTWGSILMLGGVAPPVRLTRRTVMESVSRGQRAFLGPISTAAARERGSTRRASSRVEPGVRKRSSRGVVPCMTNPLPTGT